MLNLDELRDRLDNVLNQETADSLNQWLNNKRDMDEEVMARIELVSVLDNVVQASNLVNITESKHPAVLPRTHSRRHQILIKNRNQRIIDIDILGQLSHQSKINPRIQIRSLRHIRRKSQIIQFHPQPLLLTKLPLNPHLDLNTHLIVQKLPLLHTRNNRLIPNIVK